MGRLAGFRYRKIVKVLRKFGFEFHRQAADSHEIWFNPQTNRYTTIPNHTGDLTRRNITSYFKASQYRSRRFPAKGSLD